MTLDGALDLETFVAKQKKLLELEKEAEIAEAQLLQSQSSLRCLCEAGVALQKLGLDGSRTGLYGRTMLTLSVLPPALEFPAHTLSTGDIVEIRGLTQAEHSSDTVLPSGVVTHTTARTITVAVEELSEEFNVTSHQSSPLALVKLANDVTHRRLASALESLAVSSSHLVSVLLGQTEPATPHQTLAPVCTNSCGELDLLDTGLDSSQREAVVFALKQRDLAVIHGPPGTGKTTTLVELVRQTVRMGDRVLVCASSNVAVDNLLERLHRHKVRVVRLGHPARTAQELQCLSLDARIASSDEGALVRDVYKELDVAIKGGRKMRGEVKELRKELRLREKKAIKEILSRAEVVLGTLTSSSSQGPLKHLPENHFSLTVIDECSQSLETACWIVAGSAQKLVVGGDHLQLPPTIKSSEAAKQGLELTLMERLIALHGNSVTKMLCTQYRMNSAIMKWSSDAMYEGRLEAAERVASHTLSDLKGVNGETDVVKDVLLLIDTAGCGMEELTGQDSISRCNEGEAGLVVTHVQRLVEAGVSIQDIAVVTPYNLQVELLRLNLRPLYPDLEIKSVDGFQGREKEAVLLSLVRSNPRKEVGFLGESRRLNVAVTRARRQVTVVCDTETVRGDPFLAAFIDYMETEGEVQSANQYQELPNLQRPEGLQELKAGSTGIKGASSESKGEVKKKSKDNENTSKKKIKVPSKNEGATTVFSSTDIRERSEREERKPNKYKERMENTEKNEDRQKQFEKLISDFVKSKEKELKLSPELNSFERRVVHEISENFGLLHESTGEGAARHIVVSKKSDVSSVAKTKNDKIESTKFSVDLPNDVGKEVEDKNSIDHQRCPNCQRNVPNKNFELHEARCPAKLLKEEEIEIKDVKPKKKKKKQEKKSEESEEDFDALCSQFQKLDRVCNFERCKTLVATLGVECKFCKLRFCLSHSMAEVHGCGAHAKTAARQQMFKDGVWNPGSGGQGNKKVDPVKRGHLARKLEKNIGEKEGQRQRKKKE